MRGAARWLMAHQRRVSLAVVLAAAALFVLGHHLDASVPHPGAPGWSGWIDQGRYIEAARAWAALSLDPARHWYAPGYPMLAAPFANLLPDDPFYPIDLACVVASGLLFAALGERLAFALPAARVIASLVFLTELLGSRLLLRSFIEPWTSTPATPLALGTLLLAFRFLDRPGAAAAGWLGLVATSALLFRPVDAVVLTAVVGVFALAVMVAARPTRRAACGIVAAGALGAIAPALLGLALHWAINGWTAGAYLVESQAVGFEWRLLAFRWVTVMASAAPLLDNQQSLSQAFPWVVPGIAGMVACLAVARGRMAARHALTIGLVLAHVTLYLAYRDLEPQGLIRYGNYHYFRWALMLLGLYGALLPLLAWQSRHALRAWALGVAAVFVLFCWRADWAPAPGYDRQPQTLSPQAMTLDGGLHALLDGIMVPADGDFEAIYLGPHTMAIGGQTWRANIAFKTWPVPGGLVLMLHRLALNQTLTLHVAPGVTLDPARPPVVLRAVLSFGLPSWMRPALSARP